MTTPTDAGYLLGLERIGRALGCNRSTVLSWANDPACPLPIWKRRLGPRDVWVIHETVLTAWQLSRAARDRRRRFSR